MTVRSNNAQLQAIFDKRVEEVRSKEFPYKPLRPARRDWARYNAAQENEFPEVIGMIGTFIGKASDVGAKTSVSDHDVPFLFSSSSIAATRSFFPIDSGISR